jgi:hypothetical protein
MLHARADASPPETPYLTRRDHVIAEGSRQSGVAEIHYFDPASGENVTRDLVAASV